MGRPDACCWLRSTCHGSSQPGAAPNDHLANALRPADLLHIAREGLKASLPHGWKPCKTIDTGELGLGCVCVRCAWWGISSLPLVMSSRRALKRDRLMWLCAPALSAGEVYYFNFLSGASTWDHPCDEVYKAKVVEGRRARGSWAQPSIVSPLASSSLGGGGKAAAGASAADGVVAVVGARDRVFFPSPDADDKDDGGDGGGGRSSPVFTAVASHDRGQLTDRDDDAPDGGDTAAAGRGRRTVTPSSSSQSSSRVQGTTRKQGTLPQSGTQYRQLYHRHDNQRDDDDQETSSSGELLVPVKRNPAATSMTAQSAGSVAPAQAPAAAAPADSTPSTTAQQPRRADATASTSASVPGKGATTPGTSKRPSSLSSSSRHTAGSTGSGNRPPGALWASSSSSDVITVVDQVMEVDAAAPSPAEQSRAVPQGVVAASTSNGQTTASVTLAYTAVTSAGRQQATSGYPTSGVPSTAGSKFTSRLHSALISSSTSQEESTDHDVSAALSTGRPSTAPQPRPSIISPLQSPSIESAVTILSSAPLSSSLQSSSVDSALQPRPSAAAAVGGRIAGSGAVGGGSWDDENDEEAKEASGQQPSGVDRTDFTTVSSSARLASAAAANQPSPGRPSSSGLLVARGHSASGSTGSLQQPSSLTSPGLVFDPSATRDRLRLEVAEVRQRHAREIQSVKDGHTLELQKIRSAFELQAEEVKLKGQAELRYVKERQVRDIQTCESKHADDTRRLQEQHAQALSQLKRGHDEAVLSIKRRYQAEEREIERTARDACDRARQAAAAEVEARRKQLEDDAAEASARHDAAIAALEAAHQSEVDRTRVQHAKDLQTLWSEHQAGIAVVQAQHRAALQALEAKHRDALHQLQIDIDASIAARRGKLEAARQLESDADGTLAEVQQHHADAIAAVEAAKAEGATRVEAMRQEHERVMQAIRGQIDEAHAAAEAELKGVKETCERRKLEIEGQLHAELSTLMMEHSHSMIAARRQIAAAAATRQLDKDDDAAGTDSGHGYADARIGDLASRLQSGVHDIAASLRPLLERLHGFMTVAAAPRPTVGSDGDVLVARASDEGWSAPSISDLVSPASSSGTAVSSLSVSPSSARSSDAHPPASIAATLASALRSLADIGPQTQAMQLPSLATPQQHLDHALFSMRTLAAAVRAVEAGVAAAVAVPSSTSMPTQVATSASSSQQVRELTSALEQSRADVIALRTVLAVAEDEAGRMRGPVQPGSSAGDDAHASTAAAEEIASLRRQLLEAQTQLQQRAATTDLGDEIQHYQHQVQSLRVQLGITEARLAAADADTRTLKNLLSASEERAIAAEGEGYRLQEEVALVRGEMEAARQQQRQQREQQEQTAVDDIGEGDGEGEEETEEDHGVSSVADAGVQMEQPSPTSRANAGIEYQTLQTSPESVQVSTRTPQLPPTASATVPTPASSSVDVYTALVSSERSRLTAITNHVEARRSAVSAARAAVLADRALWKSDARSLVEEANEMAAAAALVQTSTSSATAGGAGSDCGESRGHLLAHRRALLQEVKKQIDGRTAEVNADAAALRHTQAWLEARSGLVEQLSQATVEARQHVTSIGIETAAASSSASASLMASWRSRSSWDQTGTPGRQQPMPSSLEGCLRRCEHIVQELAADLASYSSSEHADEQQRRLPLPASLLAPVFVSHHHGRPGATDDVRGGARHGGLVSPPGSTDSASTGFATLDQSTPRDDGVVDARGASVGRPATAAGDAITHAHRQQLPGQQQQPVVYPPPWYPYPYPLPPPSAWPAAPSAPTAGALQQQHGYPWPIASWPAQAAAPGAGAGGAWSMLPPPVPQPVEKTVHQYPSTPSHVAAATTAQYAARTSTSGATTTPNVAAVMRRSTASRQQQRRSSGDRWTGPSSSSAARRAGSTAGRDDGSASRARGALDPAASPSASTAAEVDADAGVDAVLTQRFASELGAWAADTADVRRDMSDHAAWLAAFKARMATLGNNHQDGGSRGGTSTSSTGTPNAS